MNLLSLGLVLHITGVALLAGGTLGTYVSLRQLWQYVPGEQQKASLVLRTANGYGLFFAIGGILILVSGYMMLRAYAFSITDQSWFRIKMALVLLLFLNARILATPVIGKLNKLMSGQAPVSDVPQLFSLKRRLNIFYMLQCLVFLAIFVLVVYKF